MNINSKTKIKSPVISINLNEKAKTSDNLKSRKLNHSSLDKKIAKENQSSLSIIMLHKKIKKYFHILYKFSRQNHYILSYICIIAIITVSVYHVIMTNVYAVKGYELSRQQQITQQKMSENQKLQIQQSSAKSAIYNEVKIKYPELGLVEVKNLKYFDDSVLTANK